MNLQELHARETKVSITVKSWTEADREIAVILLREMGLTVGFARRSLALRLFESRQEEAGAGDA